ncbi:MAG: ribonuclease HII, partial [Candidatus Saccharimonadales bacterium]
MIVGIDEVGRGPWAGPLVFGAVVLGEHSIVGLTDSKKLSKKRREILAKQINEQAESVGLGWVSATEIDSIGLSRALSLGCQRALEAIKNPYSQIILDGTVNLLKATGKGPFVTTMAKADLLVPSVSAASIVAKVARDEYMTQQDELYPGYGFSSHAGYGTAKHIQAIDELGVTPLHRLS